MATDIDDLTVEYTEGGQQLVRELDKVVLTRGAWTTIIFRYQDFDPARGDFGPEKFTIRRYQKRAGQYQQKSRFNISSADQARKIIEALQSWVAK